MKHIHSDTQISFQENFSYGLGDTACNIAFALTSSLLIYFYTNVMQVSAALVGGILLISRIFDGISDIAIGFLVDRTTSKHGKARAWILWMMIPYALSIILLFTVPQTNTWVTAIYIFLTYNFCTTFVYTALNLPYATLASLITRDTQQRVKINIFRAAMSTIGNMAVTAATFPLVTYLGNTQAAWIKVSVLYAVIAVVMLAICFCGCRERVSIKAETAQGEQVSVKMGLKLIVQNKYFILFFALSVFMALDQAVSGATLSYYAQYILANRNYTGVLNAFESGAQFILVLIAAPFINKIGKRNVALWGSVIAVIGLLMLRIAPGEPILACFVSVLHGIGKGCFRSVKYAMLSDVIEYGHWKTGIRLEGIIVSGVTAGQKFGTGVTLGLVGFLLEKSGFMGGEYLLQNSKLMILNLYTYGVAAAWLLVSATLIFYKLDTLYPKIMRELAQRKERV